MIQCPYCFQLSHDNTFCYNCNVDLITDFKTPYNAIQEFCKNNDLDFEKYYGVFKELPNGYKKAVLNDLYKTTKTTQKIHEGKEIIIQAFHSGYYEKYTLKSDSDIKVLIPFFKDKRVYYKSN